MDNKDKGLKRYAKNSPINTESEEKDFGFEVYLRIQG